MYLTFLFSCYNRQLFSTLYYLPLSEFQSVSLLNESL